VSFSGSFFGGAAAFFPICFFIILLPVLSIDALNSLVCEVVEGTSGDPAGIPLAPQPATIDPKNTPASNAPNRFMNVGPLELKRKKRGAD
jgi:hypothetical protein